MRMNAVARTVRSVAVTDASSVVKSWEGSESRSFKTTSSSLMVSSISFSGPPLTLLAKPGGVVGLSQLTVGAPTTCLTTQAARNHSIAGFSLRTIGLLSPAITWASRTSPFCMRYSAVVEDLLRVAQFLEVDWVGSRLEPVGAAVDQAQRLDRAQVTRCLNARSGEPGGPVLGDDRRPHSERSERQDGQKHAGDGDSGNQFLGFGNVQRWNHVSVPIGIKRQMVSNAGKS